MKNYRIPKVAGREFIKPSILAIKKMKSDPKFSTERTFSCDCDSQANGDTCECQDVAYCDDCGHTCGKHE